MTYSDIIKHYGTAADAAAKLRITPQAIHNWKMRGKIPAMTQFLIQVRSHGRLRADVGK